MENNMLKSEIVNLHKKIISIEDQMKQIIETNNIEEAKKLAKRIIYLSGISPLSISAYVKLASLYEQENNPKKAIKTYNIALELLQNLPSQAQVEYTDNVTVAELIASLNSIIENLN
jgi:chemotaxis protein methyltransferase CheR